MSRVSLSSLESAVDLMRSNPLLLTIPALQGLRPLVQRDRTIRGGGCCGAQEDLSAYRGAFEQALRSLTDGQKTQMKSILGVNEISYYARTNGKIEEKVI